MNLPRLRARDVRQHEVSSHWPFLTQVWQSLLWLESKSSTLVRRALTAIGLEMKISKPFSTVASLDWIDAAREETAAAAGPNLD
jgi:hypothetical protein